MSGHNDCYDGGDETSSTETMESSDNTVDNSGETTRDASPNAAENSVSGRMELNGNNTETGNVEKTEAGKTTENNETEKPAFTPNSRVNIDGNYYRTDDKGNIHMYYDKEDKEAPWKLVPDNKYTVNGYEYATDNKGRILEAKGTITARDDNRDSLNAKVEDMKETDQRGHIIADVNNGSNRVDNLIAMDKGLNNGEYRDLETKLNSLSKEHDVKSTYSLIYNENNDSKRPDLIVVNYTIDGEKYNAIFDNNPEED